MSFIGTLHEISFYGLIVSIWGLICKKITIQQLISAATHPDGFKMIFLCYLFWASVLFIPLAVIGAFVTKYVDDGEGLSFSSDKIVVIIFAHIGEELLGLILTPIWFIKDAVTKDFEFWKVVDYIVYVILLIFIIFGILVLK